MFWSERILSGFWFMRVHLCLDSRALKHCALVSVLIWGILIYLDDDYSHIHEEHYVSQCRIWMLVFSPT